MESLKQLVAIYKEIDVRMHAIHANVIHHRWDAFEQNWEAYNASSASTGGSRTASRRTVRSILKHDEKITFNRRAGPSSIINLVC